VPVGRDLIERFHAAFAKAYSCAPDVRLWHPVFQELRDVEAGAIPRMLTGRPRGLREERTADNARVRSASQALRLTVVMPGWTLLAWPPARRGAGAALGQVLAPWGRAG
jgi:hypothetical protein